MNSEELSELKKIISNQIVEISSEIVELIELTKPVPLDASIGRISRMDAINNKAINEMALRDKKQLIQKLNRTIERMDEKGFGNCLKCGNVIPFGRLKIMPSTTRCVHCSGR